MHIKTDTCTYAFTYTHDIEYAGVHNVLEQLQHANTPTPKAIFVFPPHVHPQENQPNLPLLLNSSYSSKQARLVHQGRLAGQQVGRATL